METTRISSHEEVIGDLDESCFGAVEGTETRLELFLQVIMGEMGVKLRRNVFFLKFWK